MYFRIIYSDKRLYHARLFDSEGQLLFWTKESPTKQTIVDICKTVRREMTTATPIYDGMSTQKL